MHAFAASGNSRADMAKSHDSGVKLHFRNGQITCYKKCLLILVVMAPCAQVMACMEKAMAEEADWGVVFFRYDWFSAVRTEVVRVVRYDTFITVYKSDCDFHPRVRQKWRTLNHSGVCRGCKIQVGFLISGPCNNCRSALWYVLHHLRGTDEHAGAL